jgi:peptidoglycan/LPS O-acetylase OafA/YrhL
MRRDETHSAPQPLTRGGPLDALRFLAAFFMVIHHYSVDAPVPLDTIHPVLGRGYLATDFFLVVSGYVLGRIYGDRVAGGMGAGPFLLRRAGRVVPAHLMVAAAFVGLVLLTGVLGIAPTHPKWFDWAELPQQLLLVQSWGVFGGGLGWNAPTWSLSALLACYVAFPALWRALMRVRSPALVLALGLAGLGVADLATQTLTGYPVYQMPMHYGVVRAAPLFFLGVTLAVVAERIAIPQKAAVALGLGAAALLAMVQAAGRFDFVSIALIGLVILAAGAVKVTRPSHVLEKAALVSFSLFITNELVRVAYFGVGQALAARLGLGESLQWAIWLGAPLAAVVFAVGFHYLVDWPTQGWIKARLNGTGPSLKARLANLLPHPDPSFDPFAAEVGKTPRVREILLHSGPLPGGFYGREQLEGSAGLAWG